MRVDVLILLRMKSNCVFLKLYISYLHWLALKFVSIFCISIILSTPNHDFVPKEPVSVTTKVRFGTQKVCFGTQKVRFGIEESPFRSVSVPRKSVSVSRKVRFGPFRSVSVRSGPSRSVSVSTKVRFGTQKVRFGIHKSPFRSVPVRFGPFRSVSVRSGPFR